jgi:hypothetical protein
MEEQITLQPVRATHRAKAVDLRGDDVRYEFDLSALPPKSQVTHAVLKMYALSKGVLTRFLSLAEPSELSPAVVATAFLESDVPFMDSRPASCRHSSVHWAKGAGEGMMALMVLGGGGGKVPYVSGSGWEEWDFTAVIQAAIRSSSPSISVRNVRQQLEPTDAMILSAKAVHLQMVYAGIADEARRPILMITLR